MPAAGHLEHTPAHIMQRVGRYEDATEANRKGVSADLAYFAMTKPLDYYVMYTAHNYQFLAFSAAMESRRAETIEAARQSRALVSDDMLLTMPGQIGMSPSSMSRWSVSACGTRSSPSRCRTRS